MRARKEPRGDLPESIQVAGRTIPVRNRRIPHQEILQATKSYADLVDAYREKVMSQKTRTIRLLGRKNSARIIHTLLGYEVQASYKRVQCPDLVTARYLRLFTELGCRSIQLPYDPTLTARLIPQFEAMVENLTQQITELFPQDLPTRRYVIQQAYATIRHQLRAALRIKEKQATD